ALEIQAAALEHCARAGDRFAILDSLPVGGLTGAAGIRRVMEQWNSLPPREGALYFPWVSVERGADSAAARSFSKPAFVPPCGHVAGVYARVDARTGIHKAPANEVLEGVIDLARHLDDGEQAGLNEQGVNCLRSFPGRGIRVWGARTLSGQAEWCFVNVARLVLSLRRWLRLALVDLVFEPNDAALWHNVRDRLNSYCLGLFEQGAIKGVSADQAFFVKCDAETNPRESREAGEMVAQIGLAPLAPLEFVVVQITRRVGGSIEIQPTTL
ncbi:MAG: phage tail sheath subtilisin-like domain-containing protein, partial [Burkholderiaceae bacterium]